MSSFAFTVDPARLAPFAARRRRRGTALLVIGIIGLVFGVFWVIWGIVLVLLSEQKAMGVMVSVVASGPTIGAIMAMSGGSRRRAEAELCSAIAILGDARGEVTIDEIAHLTGFDARELQGLSRALSRDGAVTPTRPASGELPAVIAALGGPALRTFRRARGRRAILLGVFAMALLGFASFWTVVAIAGFQSGDWAPALVLLVGSMFPWIGGAALLVRARNHRRRAHWLARLVASAAAKRATTLEVLASHMRVKGGEARETALEAAELGVVPRELLRHLSEPGAGPSPRVEPLVLESLVGRTLSRRWRVESLLARGGMGAVFRARAVGETADAGVAPAAAVAVKVLLPGLGEDAVRRFEREATSASKLGHPGIVRVLDFGRSEDGAAFLVMELLEGETLEARLQREGVIPWREATAIARQVGDALSCAHLAGLLHRDIKPANVLLVPRPGGVRAVLVDFGLVKPIEDNVVSRLTTSGVVAGTPLYMSPEQASGEPLDVRSDVYALGVVLFETITGTPPFFDRTVAQVYARLLREAAPRARELSTTCPPALDEALARALERAPDARFPSMQAFVRALEAAEAGAPETATGAA
jgi:hypothetical protein